MKCSFSSGPVRTEREEILESLHVHKDLIVVDSSNNLRLKERHRFIKTDKTLNVKGHLLSHETVRISIPAISVAIYMNPTLAFLAKPAILAVCVKQSENGTIFKGIIKNSQNLFSYIKNFFCSTICSF